MNGYSTGWKFNGWWDIAAGLSGVAVVPTSATTSVAYTAPLQSWNGAVSTEPLMQYAISVHGYNAIRLRFPMTAPVFGEIVSPVAWRIYLVESNAEPDQTADMWMMSLFATISTSFPTTASIPTAPSATYGDFFNMYGKSWMRLANQVRIVMRDTAFSTMKELAPETTVTTSENAAYLANTFAGVLGSFSSLGAHQLTIATGAPVSEIYSDVALFPTYSPGLGHSTVLDRAGEAYINNLGGAQYLLCVPTKSIGYSPSTTKYAAPSAAVATLARSVGLMYNLIQ